MTAFVRKTVKFIGGGVKQYIGIIADSSEILGGIGDELY